MKLTCTWRITLANRLLQSPSPLIDSLATPSAIMVKILGRFVLSGPRTMGLLLREETTLNSDYKPASKSPRVHIRQHSPFNEVTEIVKRVDRLLFILVEWQPGQPMREDFSDVDTLWAVLHDFGHSRDAVLGGVDVLFNSGVCRLDHTHKQRDGLWKNNYNMIQYKH